MSRPEQPQQAFAGGLKQQGVFRLASELPTLREQSAEVRRDFDAKWFLQAQGNRLGSKVNPKMRNAVGGRAVESSDGGNECDGRGGEWDLGRAEKDRATRFAIVVAAPKRADHVPIAPALGCAVGTAF